MDISAKTALELGGMIKSRKLSCEEVALSYISRCKKLEPKLNVYISLWEHYALSAAKAVQGRLDSGEELSPLAGVPMAIKDNICTKDKVTTCASKILAGFRPPYNATVVERLEGSGAVVLGKLNMDEFAMGGSSETSAFGHVKNPWDLTRIPGGSSGGSAAAVAAGEAGYTLGTDTGGSIRQPCSFCGVSGIKPTYGSVSRYGLIAFASSLDQIGPIGKDIADCAAVLEMISGHDPRDSTSAKRAQFNFSAALNGGVKGLRIGIPRECFGDGLDSEVAASVMESGKKLEAMGAVLKEIDLPINRYAVAAYYVHACAEASSNLSRYDGVKYGYSNNNTENLADLYIQSRSDGFGIEVKRRIMLGSFVLSSGHYDAFYRKSMTARERIKAAYSEAFADVDLILAPVAPTCAYKLGEKVEDPLKMYLGDIYTVAVNLAGLPAASIPCGFNKNGLPIGMQLIGNMFAESLLIGACAAFQRETDFHKRTASLMAEVGE